jgi:hypothetical protein
MTLLELQRRMAEDVMRPLTSDFLMQETTEAGVSTSEVVSSYIRPNDRLSSFERLEIYNRQYWFRVIDAVSEDFPVLNAILGTEDFNKLILAYLRDSPSTSFTLRNLGSKMPEWIRRHPEYTGEGHDLAVDVVDLEWAYVEAFDRAALPPLDLTDQSGFDPTSLLRLQPHLQLLDLRYPVDELVLAVHREIPSSDIMSNAVSERPRREHVALPPMERRDTRLAVHRFENSVYYRRLEKEPFELLSSLQSGEPLSVAFDVAFRDSELNAEEQMAMIQDCFALAAQVGWFCRSNQ